jgi:coproporphyrinogen III oxidase-like Fe-S oxidoreductase
MLGLRLDEPVTLDGLELVVDREARARLVWQRLVERSESGIRLTPHGRLLGGGVTAELLAV